MEGDALEQGALPHPQVIAQQHCKSLSLQSLSPTKEVLGWLQWATVRCQGVPSGNTGREQGNRKAILCPHRDPKGQQGAQEPTLGPLLYPLRHSAKVWAWGGAWLLEEVGAPPLSRARYQGTHLC